MARAHPANLAARVVLWLLLGCWLGAWACFGLLVAPAAFQVLPSTELAGKLVAPVLSALNYYGASAGVLLAALAVALRRSRALVVMALLGAALCLGSEWVVTARIEAIRPLAFGPSGNPESAALFQKLHRLSVLLYSGVGLCALVLLFSHARADGVQHEG